MVVPWAGIPLARVLDAVEPTSAAKYVAFETLLDPVRMPGQKAAVLEWPYVEGLRLDEALHPLTILATGLYGKELPPQDGAPVRLVVPWKYGFKGIKSIVRITLTDKQPVTSWNRAGPDEYGFFANVNPKSTIPAGVRPPNNAWASPAVARHFRSTVTPHRSPTCTRAWTFARTSDGRVGGGRHTRNTLRNASSHGLRRVLPDCDFLIL